MKRLLKIIIGINFLAISHLGFTQINCQPLQIDRESLLKKMQNDFIKSFPISNSSSKTTFDINEMLFSGYLKSIKAYVYSDACNPNAKIMTINEIISHPISSDPLIKAQQFKTDFWLAYNSAKYDPKFLNSPTIDKQTEKEKAFFANYGDDAVKLYENYRRNPLVNGDTKKQAAFIQKILDYYIPPNTDLKKAEQILRDAEFEIPDKSFFIKSKDYTPNQITAFTLATDEKLTRVSFKIEVKPNLQDNGKVENTGVTMYSMPVITGLM